MIVAFENDCENTQNDAVGFAEQSLFLVDDSQKIYQLKDEGDKLVIAKTIDVPNKNLNVEKLRDTDWARVHISQKVIAFDGVIYSLKSKLCPKMKIMDSYKNDKFAESFRSLSDFS